MLYLHIGFHKAGSTTLQTFLRDNAPALARAGVVYPEIGRDPEAIAAASHAIKGSVGLFSNGVAFESARSLEHAARRGELGSADAECEALGTALERLSRSLKRLVEDLREKN